MASSDDPHTLLTRRDLLTRAGWAALGVSLFASAAASVRLLFPRVSYRPRSTVVLGPPDDFAVGEVSTRWKDSHRLVLIREDKGFYALRSVCTHLGCIPSWNARARRFKCPCHGSGFYASGINYTGPAPRPLERLKIFLDDGGRVVVDTDRVYRQEKGEWESPEAYLPWQEAKTA